MKRLLKNLKYGNLDKEKIVMTLNVTEVIWSMTRLLATIRIIRAVSGSLLIEHLSERYAVTSESALESSMWRKLSYVM